MLNYIVRYFIEPTRTTSKRRSRFWRIPIRHCRESARNDIWGDDGPGVWAEMPRAQTTYALILVCLLAPDFETRVHLKVYILTTKRPILMQKKNLLESFILGSSIRFIFCIRSIILAVEMQVFRLRPGPLSEANPYGKLHFVKHIFSAFSSPLGHLDVGTCIMV